MKFCRIFFGVMLFVFTSVCAFGQISEKAITSKIEKIIKKLTLEEKISLLHGKTNFTIPGIDRLGIPGLTMSDGPHGVREDLDEKSWAPANSTKDSATYLPHLNSLAATWNVDLANEFGKVIAREARARNKDVMLGPGINIIRTPLGGRNFEYMSEDPYLISKLTVPLVKGIQYNGTIACVKHFALNNQENDRFKVNVNADERTLREIYLPGFEAAVKEGGALAVMGAYNKFRGEYCCQNNYLLNTILKDEWGFKGVVISDWDGTHSTIDAALNGLDIEMGTDKPFDQYYMAVPLLNAVRNKSIDEKLINEKVRRILYVIYKGKMEGARYKGELNSKQNRNTALEVAKEGIVLLKNEGNILPLKTNIKSIAVIGDNAVRKHSYGGGSSMIKTPFEITPLEGIKAKYGEYAKINYAQGYSINNKDSINYLKSALETAKNSDIVLFVGGLNHSFDDEGRDKKDMKLPYGQDELINEIVKVNPNTIVVLVCGSPVEVNKWSDKVKGIILTWYNGMYSGTALASVLSGETNPSGKMPFTFPQKLEDTFLTDKQSYPGIEHEEEYKEGLLVGYRWFDTKKIEPQFPFGYGLSYSTFEYKDIKSTVTYKNQEPVVEVKVRLKNTSKIDGKETIQLYVKDLTNLVSRPEKELKAFKKVYLKKGEEKSIAFLLDKKSLEYYDVNRKAMNYNGGTYEICIASSSRDIKLTGKVVIHK